MLNVVLTLIIHAGGGGLISDTFYLIFGSQRKKVQLSVILVWTWQRIILIYLTAASDGIMENKRISD